MTPAGAAAARASEREIAVRLVVVQPPAGVTLAVQQGSGSRPHLIAPSSTSAGSATFDLTLRARDGDPPVLLGDVTQGPPAGRFVYVNWGASAGQLGSPWVRRAKIPLGGITRALLDALDGEPGAVVEARIAGTGRDGGPACATVKLLDAGWHVSAAR